MKNIIKEDNPRKSKRKRSMIGQTRRDIAEIVSANGSDIEVHILVLATGPCVGYPTLNKGLRIGCAVKFIEVLTVSWTTTDCHGLAVMVVGICIVRVSRRFRACVCERERE